jgi:hypothetical protein
MKKTLLFGLLFLFSQVGFSQAVPDAGSCKSGTSWDAHSYTGWVDGVGDFTIVDSDGITHNLYETLEAGKTVMLDLFQSL